MTYKNGGKRMKNLICVSLVALGLAINTLYANDPATPMPETATQNSPTEPSGNTNNVKPDEGANRDLARKKHKKRRRHRRHKRHGHNS